MREPESAGIPELERLDRRHALGRVAALEAKAKDLEARLQGGMTTISDLRAATSWRITYPLRALKRLPAQVARYISKA